jgi:hypothetical protein
MYMKMRTPSRMVNYGIALALFGILVFSLIATVEPMTSKKEEKGDKKEDKKEEKEDKKDSIMLTRDEAEKMVEKIKELNLKATSAKS